MNGLFNLLAKKISFIAIGLGVSCLALALATHIFGYDQIAIVLLFAAGGCGFFVVTDRKGTDRREPGAKHDSPWKATAARIIDICLVGCVLASLLVLIMHGLPVFKPPLFYVLISLAYGFVFLRITLIEHTPSTKHALVPMIEIVSLTLLLKGSFFLGVYQYEDDPGSHLFFVEEIVRTGFLPSPSVMEVYYNVPGFHILMASTALVTGLDGSGTPLIAALMQSAAIVFVYLLAEKFTDDIRASLYSALLLATLGLNIKYSVTYTTQGLSLVIVVLLIYLILSEFKSPRYRLNYTILLLLSFSSIVFWHYFYSAVSLVLILIAIFSLKTVDRLRALPKGWSEAVPSRESYVNLSLVLVVSWIAYLMYSNSIAFGGGVSSLRDLLSLSPLLRNIQIEPQAGIGNFAAYTLVYLDFFILIGLSIAGVLSLLKSRGRYQLLLVSILIIYSAIIVVPILTNVEALRPRIHFYFFESLLVIAAAYAIICLLRGQSKRVWRLFAIGSMTFLVISFSFFSMTSRLNNELDPIFYSGEVPAPWHHSYSEKVALEEVSTLIPKDTSIVTDLRTGSRGSIPGDRYKPGFFSEKSLPELDSGYRYIIINTDSIDKGLIFWALSKGVSYGYDIDREQLDARLSQKELLFNSGVIQLYRSR